MAKQRIDVLDLAKGIGIILVALGHCIPLSSDLGELIFTFHMPLFFMLSGYVFHTKGDLPALVFKKSHALLRPYIRYFLLGLAVTAVLPVWREGLTGAGIWQDIYMASPNAVHNSSIWYLVCLFFVCLAAWFLFRLPSGLAAAILVVCYIAGVWYSRHPFGLCGFGRLPLNLDVVPVALVFFAVGYYLRPTNVLQRMTDRPVPAAVSLLLFTVLTVVIHHVNGYVNLHGMTYRNPVLYLLGGLSGSFATLSLCCLVDRLTGALRPVKRVLLWYGRHSLWILGVQSLLIRLYVLAVQYYRGTELKLYYFPWKHAVVCGIAVTFVLCPLICLAQDSVLRYVASKTNKKETTLL